MLETGIDSAYGKIRLLGRRFEFKVSLSMKEAVQSECHKSDDYESNRDYPKVAILCRLLIVVLLSNCNSNHDGDRIYCRKGFRSHSNLK